MPDIALCLDLVLRISKMLNKSRHYTRVDLNIKQDVNFENSQSVVMTKKLVKINTRTAHEHETQ